MEADSAGPERPFPCQDCPKKYLRKNNLDDHILTDHPESDKALVIIEYKAKHGRSKGNLIIQCDICNKRFRYQSDLRNHVESHYRGRGRITMRNGPVGVPLNDTSPSPTRKLLPKSSTPRNPNIFQAQPFPTGVSSGHQRGRVGDRGPSRKQPSFRDGDVKNRQLMPSPTNTSFRTRPCLYCGKTFFSNEQLKIHEDVEASEFEKEVLDFDCKSKEVLVEQQVPNQSHEIDRTDEEFGGWPPPQHHDFRMYPTNNMEYRNNYYPNNLNNKSMYISRTQNMNSNYKQSRVFEGREYSNPCNNHTSQYVSQDPVCPQPPNADQLYQEPPPPAHEDPTIVHGFLPPPPPLPVPQFSQPSLNTRHVADYPAPITGEEKIYTLLESSEQTLTKSSLNIGVDNNKSSLEVLDLSLPKQCDPDTIIEKVAEYENSLNFPTQSHLDNTNDDKNGQAINLAKAENLNKDDYEKNSNDDQTIKEEGESVKPEDASFKEDKVILETSNYQTNTIKDFIENGSPTIEDESYSSRGSSNHNDDEHESHKLESDTKDNLPVNDTVVGDSIVMIETTQPLDDIYKQDIKEEITIKESIVTLDASSLPSMPEANITFATESIAEHDKSTSNHNGRTAFDDEYEGLIKHEEGMEYSSPASPLQFEDPNRLDCKFCGMIFDAPHIRKFHEAGHNDEHNEYHGDNTRMYCGWCGKTFKKVAYRILHEKGHTGELAITCHNCGKGFRWESELKSHSANCSSESPAKHRHISKHVDKEDWIENHPSMPTGWRIRSRPRPNQEGQRFFIFLSPEGQVFYSRKSMLGHMEKTGGYSLEDLDKVRRHTKAALRGLDTTKLNDSTLVQPTTPTNPVVKKSIDSKGEGVLGECAKWMDCSLTPGWMVRKTGTRVEFLSPDRRIFTNQTEVVHLMKNPTTTSSLVTSSSSRGFSCGSSSDALHSDESSQSAPAQDEMRPGPGPEQQSTPTPPLDMDWEKVIEAKICFPSPTSTTTTSYVVNDNIAKLNQASVTQEWKLLRLSCIENLNLPHDTFDQDPVVFVPKITKLIQDEEFQDRLSRGDNPKKLSVAVNLIHSDEGYENNIDELKTMMTRRQRENYRKAKAAASMGKLVDGMKPLPEDAENEVKCLSDSGSNAPPGTNPEQRSLRFKQRHNYEEMNDEDFNSLLPKPKFLNRGNQMVAAPAISSSSVEEIPRVSHQQLNNVTPSMRVKERNRMTDGEIALMEKWFSMNPYPSQEERFLIAEMMEMPEKKVRVWFQNKRYKTEDGRMKCLFAKTATNVGQATIAADSSPAPISMAAPATSVESSLVIGPDAQFCEDCQQNFTNDTDFQIHVKRVHGSEAERVVCKDCLSTFDTMWNLKTHCIEHHFGTGGNSDLYTDYQSSEINGSRTKFTRSQIITMRNSFSRNPYPSKEEYRELQTNLGVSNKILHSWFQNHRHREKIHSQKHHETTFDDSLDDSLNCWGGDDDDSRMGYPYNPGHRKTKFTDHQKFYLQSFFSEKEYADDEDINDLTAELQLTPKVIRIWFQHAREKKKKNLPIYTKSRSGKLVSHTPRKYKRRGVVEEAFDADDFDDFLVNEDSMNTNDHTSFKNKLNEVNNSKLEDKKLTEFQKIYLENFYKNIREPDNDDINYLCEHINVTKDRLLEWFQMKNNKGCLVTKPVAIAEKESVRICADIMNDLLNALGMTKTKSSAGSLSCPYCGKSFKDQASLKEHEKLEAIEFEKEASKFKEEDVKDDSEVFIALDDDLSRDATFDEDASFDCYENSMDSSNSDPYLTPFEIWLQEEQKRGGDTQTLTSIWQSMSEFDQMPYIEESRRLKELHRGKSGQSRFTTNSDDSVTPAGRLSRKHSAIKAYICKRCQVGFSTKGNLFKHLRHFHPENPYDPKLYELDSSKKHSQDFQRCDICNIDFMSRIGLARHKTKAHNEPDNLSGYYHGDENSSDHDMISSISSGGKYRENMDFGVPDVSSSSDSNWMQDDYQYERRPAHVKTRFTPQQRQILMDSFHNSLTMTKNDAKNFYINLSERLDLPTKIVRIWFQNARSARKRGKPLFSE